MSCDIPPPGGILSWAPEIYNITNNNNTKAVIGEVASDDLCQNSKKNVLEIFDDGTGKSPAMSEDTCARLNGRLDLVPTTENEAYETLEEYKEYTMKRNITTWFPTWLSGRADMNRTEITIRQHFTWPTLTEDMKKVVGQYTTCQLTKKLNQLCYDHSLYTIHV